MNKRSSFLLLKAVVLCGVLGTAVVLFSRSTSFFGVKHARQSEDAGNSNDTPQETPYPGTPALPSEVDSWKVVGSAGGGMNGYIQGGVIITSQGEAVAGDAMPMGEFRYSCKSQISAEQLKQVEQAIAGVNPSSWKKRYVDPRNPDGCCDQVGYGITLYRRKPDGAKQIYRTSWYDSSSYLLPKDLALLNERLNAIQTKTLKACRK